MAHSSLRKSLLLCPALVAAGALAVAAGCTTTSAQAGDHAARDVEKILLEIDQSMAAEDVAQAEKLDERLERVVRDNRKELELHPEAADLFARIDASKRNLRKLQQRVDEQQRRDALVAIESEVRQPLEEVVAIAQQVETGEVTSADVMSLRKGIDSAQDRLNEGRRNGKIEVGGEFAREIESRLDALRGTAQRAEKIATAVAARDAMREGFHALELAETRQTGAERLGDYESARNKFTSCQEEATKVQDDETVAKRRFEGSSGEKPVSARELARQCDKQLRQLAKLIKTADKEVKALEALKAYAADKSPAQQKLLEQYGKKPDTNVKKKDKVIWTFVEKKKVGKRTVRVFHQYTFDASGAIVDEKTKER
ncbi:MAG: hypothetical protein JXR83_14150 [Deltaproteobacteria bacterium]|nr:hypothetical protein [Deltaproteobacteria bacterium]